MMRRPFLIGMLGGLVFGCTNLMLTWLNPVEDDSVTAVLRFYGPMFLMWVVIAFNAARASGRWRSAVAAGAIAAFATFSVFTVLNFVRINAFLHELSARPDWQSLMARYRASGADNLRLFINLDYLKGMPFKLAAATTFGAICGGLGGTVRWLVRPRQA